MAKFLRVLTLVCVITLLGTMAIAEEGPQWPSTNRDYLDYTEGLVISHNATIRTNPSESAQKIRSAYNGECLHIVNTYNNWYEIDLENGTIGYIMSYYVLPNYECLYLCEGAPIYPYAHADKRIGYLSSGSTYAIIAETQDYWIINCRAAAAYLPKSTNVFLSNMMRWYYKDANEALYKTAKDAKVYVGPGTNYKNIGTLTAGSNVGVFYKSNGWCCIEYRLPNAEIIGFIPESCLY